jgi:hypothetical protein
MTVLTMAMVLTAQQHRLIAEFLRQKAAAMAPDPIIKAQLERLAGNHEGFALYLDRNPHRGPVPAVTAPSIAPG